MSNTPATTFEVHLEEFSGPLEKLLELIEGRELDVTRVSLAAVTIDFLNYLKELGRLVHPTILADFVAVAAKLVLIKSKTLLPDLTLTEEEEYEIGDLETRLKLYREFKRAGEGMRERWSVLPTMFSREFLSGVGNASGFFYPPARLNAADLARSLENIFSALQAFQDQRTVVKSATISLKAKITELTERLQEIATQSFAGLTTNRSRAEVVVMFLAILHLLRERTINAEQKGQFNDIILKKR